MYMSLKFSILKLKLKQSQVRSVDLLEDLPVQFAESWVVVCETTPVVPKGVSSYFETILVRASVRFMRRIPVQVRQRVAVAIDPRSLCCVVRAVDVEASIPVVCQTRQRPIKTLMYSMKLYTYVALNNREVLQYLNFLHV